MALFKCKMCGGDLEITAGSSVCTCEYCGTRQTVPTADDEKKMTLFARANRLLRSCEFDKAAGVFETIVADFPQEAEAYWGLVLCQYGIEYVDDPATGKKIPTCHRSSFDSVMDDANFEQACENTDSVARAVYREEAKRIEQLRKDIIQVSNKEEPYDIFICYKETDDKGERTLDSVLAQDTYDALTEKGYKVFFSRITLEDKLGQEYEPYIFAALNSAKVMLAFGTDYEYYNAVWVKNEWSRFLQLMAKGEKKTLIPCYKNIDPYDLPKEFAKLQAQDMGKVGAMQDLLRGVEKILPRKASTASPPVATDERMAKVTSSLKRGQMALEDGDWQQADTLFEQALSLDAENARAYLGKLCAEVRAHRIEELSQTPNFQKKANYAKVLRFADSDLKSQLEQLVAQAEQTAGNARPQTESAVGKSKKLLKILLPAAALLIAAVVILTSSLSKKQPNIEAEDPAPLAESEQEAVVDVTRVKIGVVLIGDENEDYTYTHIDGIRKAMAACGLSDENIVWCYNIPEDETCYTKCIECADEGCGLIITNSLGHQAFAQQAAEEYPEVEFVAIAGDTAKKSGLVNFHNAFNATYESRYVSGIVAGMKLKEMMDAGIVKDPHIGYVGTFPYSEVVSGYTGFFLGIKSIVPGVHMDVQYTNSWLDQQEAGKAAEALMGRGCVIIGQHADSTGAPAAVQAAKDAGKNVYSVGYNVDMLQAAPTAALTSSTNDWSVFYTYLFKAFLAGESIKTDWSEGYETGAVAITALGPEVAEGTAEAVAAAEAAIKDGSLHVFDTKTFTVDGKEVTSCFTFDSDGDWANDTNEGIVDGYYHESEYISAPSFSLRIDGITELF